MIQKDYTLILPGFSSHNQAWAEQAYIKLNLGIQGEYVKWNHWKTGNAKDFHLDQEVPQILDKLANKQYNLVAKSIGTTVAMSIIRRSPGLLKKAILCGIPLNDLSEKSLEYYKILHEVAPNRIVCFQNEFDPHGSSEEVRTFLHNFNPAIKVITKNADNHEYFYFEEIKRELDL